MKTCPSCGRISGKSEFFCDACGEPLFAGSGQQADGSMPQAQVAPAASPGQTYPMSGYLPPGYPSQEYPPPTGSGARVSLRKKTSLGRWIGLIVAACIILVVGAIAVYILTLPRIIVKPPAGWTRASDEVKKNLEETMGGDSLSELFVPQNGAPAFIAVGRVKPGSLKDLPDTQDLEVMREYVTNSRDRIAGEFSGEGLILNEVEARQLACGQGIIYVNFQWQVDGGFLAQDSLLMKKESTVFMVSVINGSYGSNLLEVESLMQNISFE
jgi:hypothetical protein